MKLNLYTIPELRAVNVMAAPDFGVVNWTRKNGF